MRLLFTLLLFANVLFAKQISIDDAKIVATNFLIELKSSSNSKTSASATNIVFSKDLTAQNIPIYVFNINVTKGFILIAADDLLDPIIAYSEKNNFETENIPSFISAWMNDYAEYLAEIKLGKNESSVIAKDRWTKYLLGTTTQKINTTASTNGVAEMLTTEWGQGDFYNSYCPYDYYTGKNVLTGCVATAMAQLMKYWEYPSKGDGSYTYYEPTFGYLSANFQSGTYNWNGMSNIPTAVNSAIGKLMYHCGVSIDTKYGSDVSISNNAYIPYSLVTYFDYNQLVAYYKKNDFSSNTWLFYLKYDLDNGMPIIYRGEKSDGTDGHAWVCDGYDNNNNFHMNWGWDGTYNGYWSIVPGDIQRSYKQAAVLDIKPNSPQGINNDDSKQTFSVFPNPSNGTFTISNLDIDVNSKLDVINNLGEVVYSTILINQASQEVNLQNLSSGFYTLRLCNNLSISQAKIQLLK